MTSSNIHYLPRALPPSLWAFRFRHLNCGGHQLSVHGFCPLMLGRPLLDAGLLAYMWPSSSAPTVLGRKGMLIFSFLSLSSLSPTVGVMRGSERFGKRDPEVATRATVIQGHSCILLVGCALVELWPKHMKLRDSGRSTALRSLRGSSRKDHQVAASEQKIPKTTS